MLHLDLRFVTFTWLVSYCFDTIFMLSSLVTLGMIFLTSTPCCPFKVVALDLICSVSLCGEGFITWSLIQNLVLLLVMKEILAWPWIQVLIPVALPARVWRLEQ